MLFTVLLANGGRFNFELDLPDHNEQEGVNAASEWAGQVARGDGDGADNALYGYFGQPTPQSMGSVRAPEPEYVWFRPDPAHIVGVYTREGKDRDQA